MDTTTNEEHNENNQEQALIPANNTLVTSNSLEDLDPTIVVDKESSMVVTRWVRVNYVEEREHNVPRKDMFEHYKAYCVANGLRPVNSATFGKLLRVVFPSLKTRRLGVRGQSKYHYCGIRVKNAYDSGNMALISEHQTVRSPAVRASASISFLPSTSHRLVSEASSSIQESDALPTFVVPLVPTYRYNHEIDHELANTFTIAYEKHCKRILHMISTHQIKKVRSTMQEFYQTMPTKFINLIQSVPEIIESIWRWDCSLYDAIINTLLPTVSHPLTQTMATVLRTYTRELKEYIENALVNFPTLLLQRKLDVARIFSAKCRRQLSLNFAAQTASDALSRLEQLVVMRQDWDRFDVDGILDQTLWICDCDANEIRAILRNEIYDLLNNKPMIEQWMEWISSIVTRFLKRYLPSSSTEISQYLSRSKQLLLKWNYYTGLIMKELSLQQAQSFASFQNLRLFLDDYIVFLVEENIAQMNFIISHHQQQQQVHPQKAEDESFFNYNSSPPSSANGSSSDPPHKDVGSN
ncbi:RFX DNA-binding domain-containing protein [Blakeslea trispora]|nr:RFX DNA-binding domain-containing protein [Blakeslea trispora]